MKEDFYSFLNYLKTKQQEKSVKGSSNTYKVSSKRVNNCPSVSSSRGSFCCSVLVSILRESEAAILLDVAMVNIRVLLLGHSRLQQCQNYFPSKDPTNKLSNLVEISKNDYLLLGLPLSTKERKSSDFFKIMYRMMLPSSEQFCNNKISPRGGCIELLSFGLMSEASFPIGGTATAAILPENILAFTFSLPSEYIAYRTF